MPGAQPMTPWGLGGAPTCTRDSLGSSAITLHCGLTDLRNLPHPEMQPPVPAHEATIRPPEGGASAAGGRKSPAPARPCSQASSTRQSRWVEPRSPGANTTPSEIASLQPPSRRKQR